jgi:hypothetical protein
MTDHPILPPRWRSRGRRNRDELIGIAIAGAGWAIQLGLFFVPHGHGYSIAMTVWGIGFFVFAAGLIMWFKAHRRAATALLACNLRLCLNCRYPLPDQPETGACSECGCRYSPEELRSGWGATYPALRVRKPAANADR